MATSLAPHIVSLAPDRDVFWVLRSAVVIVALGAWLVVLVHLAMVIRAELQLAAILRQANAFANLPQVDANELQSYVVRRTNAAKLHGAQVMVLQNSSPPGKFFVFRIEAPASTAWPRWLRPIASSQRPISVGIVESSPRLFAKL